MGCYNSMLQMPAADPQHPSPDAPLVLFDGVCNFCDATVQFVIKRDPAARVRFASLQSQFARKILAKMGHSDPPLSSIVLIENGQLFTRSTAALRISRHLKHPWPLLYAFVIVPPFVRNGIYNWIARNRYRWFGQKDA